MNVNLNEKADSIRKLTIECIGRFGIGHIGGATSISEVLAVLYFKHAHVYPSDPQKDERDRIVLSKGHAGPGLYSALCLKGFFPKETLFTLNLPGTNLPSHCDMNKTKGVDMTAGSLGQGFSAAVGMAIAAKLKEQTNTVYCIMGDGEIQEGQIWEAAMLAGNRKLNNLIAFVDNNGMQIDGYTRDINSVEPLGDKWAAFGFDVQRVDGHNVDAIDKAITKAKENKNSPSMIILDTIKGKGVSFCENKVESHSFTITEEMWKAEVERKEKKDA